jgi:Leucine-rich repeat (LRR) protein
MATRVFLLFVLLQLVQSDKLLFEQGKMRLGTHGRKRNYYNVHHIDEKLIGQGHQLVVVRAWMETVHPEAVRNLRSLENLVMAKCHIVKVENKAFVNLPNLTALRLNDNDIGEVKKGVFNELPIKVLSLQRNAIKKIDSGAFDDMPNLYKIKLNSNRLKSWDSAWFKNCPKLTELYFRRNRLNHLPASAFANIKGTHLVDGERVMDTKIFLSKNKLGTITPESFYNLEAISQLYLDRNNITEVPGGAFRDLKEIHVIYLARNKIDEVKDNAFPKVRSIGILDFSSNLLECLPYGLVTVANITNLEKNNGSCSCIRDYKARLEKEQRKNEISYEKEDCPE